MNSLNGDSKVHEFGSFAGELQVENGAPFVLQDFQQLDLVPYFEGCRELVILIPKKNGKSTLIAALALYHLLTVPNAECIIVAAAREQADIVLRQARLFVRQSPDLARLMEIQQRTIRLRGEEGRIRILASEADTLDGALPTLAIVDELHRHKSADAYGVLRNGLGPRNGQIITISTAGSRSDSPLGQMRTQAHQLATFQREGMRNTARSADGRFAFVEYCLAADDDSENLEVVKLANPAPWQTLGELAELKASSETRHVPWEWLRFFCGVWTEGEEPWIEPAVWDGLAQPFELEDKVFLGVDRGSRDEEPAIVAAAKRGDEIWVKAQVFPDGTDFEDLETAILAWAPRAITASYDPDQFTPVAERLRKAGVQMREFNITYERLSKASITLWDLIEKGRLHHDGDLKLRAHVMGGIVKEDGRGWRIQRDPKSRQAVSGLMALLMACQAAAEAPSQDLMMSWG